MEVKTQWQTQSKPKHEEIRTQTQAHQPKSYDLHDYLFKYIVEENCVIYNEGMNDVDEKLPYLTVYVRTISGKTISKDEIGRKTLKCCIQTRHNVPLVQVKMNRLTRHVSVDGQRVIRTCANGSLKYHKYQAEVEATMEKCCQKNSSQRL